MAYFAWQLHMNTGKWQASVLCVGFIISVDQTPISMETLFPIVYAVHQLKFNEQIKHNNRSPFKLG